MADRPGSPPRRRALLAGVAVAATVAAVGGGLWWNHASQRSRLPRSIAVLPFRPLLPDASNPAMELGVTELLANRLSRLPGIVVSPLSSVMRFAAPGGDPLDQGRQLGVDAVVDGNVYIQEDRVRLSARLLAVDGGVSLWANSYTERLGELLAVQDSLAIQLANALATELSDKTREVVLAHETSDVDAWQLYANGRYQLDQARRGQPAARNRVLRCGVTARSTLRLGERRPLRCPHLDSGLRHRASVQGVRRCAAGRAAGDGA